MATIGTNNVIHRHRLEKFLLEKRAEKDIADKKSADEASRITTVTDSEDSLSEHISRSIYSADEMSAVMTQFCNRRDYEKKYGIVSDNNFERILDDNALENSVFLLKKIESLGTFNVKDFFNQIKGLFFDESDFILVLREYLRSKNVENEIKNRVNELLTYAENKFSAKRVKAGINVALKARIFSKSLEFSPILLRESYRQFIESDNKPVENYQHWISLFGYSRRIGIVNFMEDALLADIDAQDPSCSVIEFGDLLMRLGYLKLLRSSEKVFISNLLNSKFICKYNKEEKSWLIFMLCILQRPEHLDDYLYEVLGERILLSDHTKRASLLQKIHQVCKTLPLELFVDNTYSETLDEKFKKLAEIINHHENIELRRKNSR